MSFTSVKFMSSKDKELVLRTWERFLKNGLKRTDFTKRLYEHLHLHCGYIAHYNIQGFYDTYFLSGVDIQSFFDNFIRYNRGFPPIDYRDINNAMIELYYKYKDTLNEQAENDISDKVALLSECVKRANTDRDFAKQFLAKLGY